MNQIKPPSQMSQPVGAVMVVGGGIAGMQAALDLADQGFKVYLVESQSAIGGKMAQLDKTFPTNDCAMCTISPKLVEVGRHPNIEVMTLTEVLDVAGQVGDFRVRVRHTARYIDPDKCVACGDCTEVCPVLVPDRFNEGLVDQHAIYKLYPQAVPNAFSIHKQGISPCRDACPAGQRAQGYIALIREGRWQDAMRVIKMDNPFPGICGRICNHRCEEACNRGQVDQPINIRALKRFVTDKIYAEPRPMVAPIAWQSDQRVAIIGAGPCGLTAAQDLTLAGYPVTVFEAMPVAGGMLRLGVPEYRLPTSIIEREVQDIIDLGIDLRLNHRIDDLDSLFDQGFTAILIAVGAHEGIRLPIPGSNLKGVLVNTHFLRDVRLGKYQNPDGSHGTASELGQRVMVLGGGNVAIDCARSAIRLGREVHLACLEGREHMPCHAWEVEAAEAEGVIVHAGRSFERILGDEKGHVQGLECTHVADFHFDERGRVHVEKIPDSTHLLACDTVIFSVGQRAGLAFIPDDANVGLTERQTIAINPNTLATSRTGVFAAGDCISGTAFVIEAVERGHTAAQSITRYLKHEPLEPPIQAELPVVHLSSQEIEQRIARGEIHRQGRIPLPELPVNQRLTNFAEVEGGYDDESAQAEAARCLACGVCSECMSCVFACGANAIEHDMLPCEQTLPVGAIILTPGYQLFQAEAAQEYGYGRYPNVITSMQFERLLSASGPTLGHVQRPSDGKLPHRIAFLQCIGSRDQQHDYCSAVCCMYATKEAIMAKEHHPELEIQIFIMDLRAFSKGYLNYYERARQYYGVQYTRCRVSGLREDPDEHSLLVQFQDESGKVHKAEFDLVVLSVGMEISPAVRELGRRLEIELDEHGFCHQSNLNPLETNRSGIYAAGPFREPKDIPESIIEASGAAAAAAARLSAARFSLTTQPEFPAERDVSDEVPRIGVFVCHCGTNIAGYLDVKRVTDFAAQLPAVVHAESNLYTCSQDSIRHISEQIQEYRLNRVVVASCTPLTHEPLFQDSLRAAGLNPFLFEMANIRNQCSWVHSTDQQAATIKACHLVQMAVGRAAQLQAQHTVEVPVNHAALIIGGGPAGMTAALTLAEQGFPVHLVEKEAELGGNLRLVFVPLDARNPQQTLRRMVDQIQAQTNITIHTNSHVVGTRGFKGNFTSLIDDTAGNRKQISHGVTILATGGQEYRGPEYLYGQDQRVMTQGEFEVWFQRQPEAIRALKSVVMILCVGPAEQYCSRICCSVALKDALALKKSNPGMQITILYKDIRTYGFKEHLYTEARAQGVLFIRYTSEQPPQVRDESGSLILECQDLTLHKPVRLLADALILAMPVVPDPEAHGVASLFKVSLDADGFFLEAHIKLRPVDFATPGYFMAGMAHYPKFLDESMIQAQAAAGRAARVLSQASLKAGGSVAVVDQASCTGCLTCIRSCPFNVPKIVPTQLGVGGIFGAAFIEPTVCQGCGICAAECPARAIHLMHYTDTQMSAKVRAWLDPVDGFVSLDTLLELSAL